MLHRLGCTGLVQKSSFRRLFIHQIQFYHEKIQKVPQSVTLSVVERKVQRHGVREIHRFKRDDSSISTSFNQQNLKICYDNGRNNPSRQFSRHHKPALSRCHKEDEMSKTDDNEDLNSENQSLEEWKRGVSQQSILSALMSILKLLGSLLITLLKTIYKLCRSLLTPAARSKAAAIRQKASEKVSPQIKKGYEATKATVVREVPKIKSKLEEGVPLAKKNIEEFGSKMKNELNDAQTMGEKRHKFFGVIGDYTKNSKGFQIFLMIIFAFFIYSWIKLLLRFFCGGCRKKE